MIVSSLFLVGCVIVSLGSIIIAKGMVDEAHKKVYVLDGTVPILVKQTTQEETFDVEAKSDIEMFHQFFFTLAPDDKYIQYTMKKAMYLVDETGLAQYNALKEKGFYNNIIGTSTICSIYCDSIKLNTDSLTFTYYGRQRIERRTSILMRQLVTAGKLRRVPSQAQHTVFENPRMGKRPQKGLSGHRVRLGNLPVRLECHQHDKILQCEQGAKTPHGSGASRESPSGAT